MAMEKVCIYVKRSKPDAGRLARDLQRWLHRRGLKSMVPEAEAKMYGLEHGLPTEECFSACDLVVVLGGDGTLLAAARLLGGRAVPVLGVNLGGMGFMIEVRQEELEETLDLVLLGQTRIVERLRLNVVVTTPAGAYGYVVLNDVVVTKSALARIFDLKVTVDGKLLNTVRADGLIVATPTGSTAYNLAAGGPVLHPQTKALVITPICPHMLTNRPIVVPSNLRVELDLVDETEVFITCDGQEGRELHHGDRIVVQACDAPLLVVKSPRRTYFEVLRQKLHYGER
jgi:NAD+ kinase